MSIRVCPSPWAEPQLSEGPAWAGCESPSAGYAPGGAGALPGHLAWNRHITAPRAAAFLDEIAEYMAPLCASAGGGTVTHSNEAFSLISIKGGALLGFCLFFVKLYSMIW